MPAPAGRGGGVGLVSAAAALLLSGLLLVRFIRAERAGRPLQVVLWLLGLLLVESLVWSDPNRVPTGLVNPDLGPTSFRLVDTVALAALLAVLIGRGVPSRFSVAALWWSAFLGWMAVAAVRGVLFGNDPVALTFQAKVIVYLGLMAVAAGVGREEWRSPAVDRFLAWSGVATAVLVVLDQLGVAVDLALPVIPLQNFGEVGTDAATLTTALGLIAVLRALTTDRSRTVLLLAAVPLLVTPFVAGQRAALLGLAIGLVVCLGLVLRAGRSLRLPGGDLVVALLALGALLTAPTAISGLLGDDLQLPLVESVSQAIDSRGKQLSAEGRLNQWREVQPLLAERPVLGWGLGRSYSYYEPGPKEHVTTTLTHNLPGDLVLRTGLVGLLLFTIAVSSTALAALRATGRAADPLLAALAVGMTAGLAAWVTKSMVESVFEKYRLAVLLGLLVGVALSLDPRGSGRGDTAGEPGSLRLDEERTGSAL